MKLHMKTNDRDGSRDNVSDNGRDEPRDDSDAEIYKGIDPDIVLISKHIDRTDTIAERAEFDRRLASDAAFGKKAYPLLAFYALPFDFTEHLRVARAELEAQRNAKGVAAGNPESETVGTANGDAAHRVGRSSPEPLPFYRRPVGTLLSRRGWSGLAAAAVIVVALTVAERRYDPPWSVAQPDHQTADYRTAAETRRIELPDGSFAWLLPKSRLRYDAHILKTQLVLDIDGSAQIEVASNVRPVQVRKITGYAELAAGGRYTVNSPESSSKLLVTVARGSAEMSNADGTRRVAVAPGNVGQYMGDGDIHVFAALTLPADWRHQ
jgi:ferric-dicitrate binding protein FerR (iron transport regulator)